MIWIRRVAHDDDLDHPTQELGDHISRSHRKKLATKNLIDGPTRPPIETSSTTTRSSGLALTEIRTMKPEEWAIKKRSIFLQQVFNDQQIYDDKIRLLFIKPYSTSAKTSAQSDRRGGPTGQIGARALELVCIEWSTSNVSPPQKKLIQVQSTGHS
jgi:hypothetical protein